MLKSNKNAVSIFHKKAFALPLALFFIFLVATFCFVLIRMNTQSKKQRNSTIMSTKAYFMALAGIQHFKLKCNLLPEEFFKCSTIYYGFSPFYVPPKGARFNLFDDPTKAGPEFYPEYLGAFMEDVNSFYTDPDGSAVSGRTVKGARALLKLKEKTIRQEGNIPTLNFKLGGFKLNDEQANDNIEEWGYKIVELNCGSLQRESSKAFLEYPFIEQSVSITVEGLAKVNFGGLNKGEPENKTNIVKETFVFRRQVMGN